MGGARDFPPLVRAGLLPVSDRRVNYSRFERVEVSVEASCVHAMLQDVSGLMWICTDKGLYNYDGYRNAEWIVIDYGHILVHIFVPEARQRYNLEELWADAVITDIENLD